MSKTSQQQRLFWPRTDELTTKEKRWLVNNRECPLSKFIGNDRAVRRMARAAFVAWGHPNHLCDRNFALVGPASTGKTTLAKLFAETVRLPFVEIDPKSINSLHDVLVEIAEVCQNTMLPDGRSLELVPQKRFHPDFVHFLLPPLVVYVDTDNMLNEELLHALVSAANRNLFFTAPGFSANCENICWIVSTTKPLDSTFTTLRFSPLTTEEIATVVQNQNPDFSSDVCRKIARRVRNPDEAGRFVREMRIQKEMAGGSWESITDLVGSDYA